MESHVLVRQSNNKRDAASKRESGLPAHRGGRLCCYRLFWLHTTTNPPILEKTTNTAVVVILKDCRREGESKHPLPVAANFSRAGLTHCPSVALVASKTFRSGSIIMMKKINIFPSWRLTQSPKTSRCTRWTLHAESHTRRTGFPLANCLELPTTRGFLHHSRHFHKSLLAQSDKGDVASPSTCDCTWPHLDDTAKQAKKHFHFDLPDSQSSAFPSYSFFFFTMSDSSAISLLALAS